MSESLQNALLPAGLGDGLPPQAAYEADVVEKIVGQFLSFGYDRVKPPLLEFEESLLGQSGAGTRSQTFRLMDPVSQKMLALRPDMTLQIARISSSRLKNRPRPLRLSYAGQVLRVKGTQLRPERQFGQVGAELIGSASPSGDAEVILMALEALTAVGIKNLSVDLGVPTLVPAICRDLGISDKEVASLNAALDRKDAAAIAAIGGKTAEIFQKLLASAGQAKTALDVLESLDLQGEAANERKTLVNVAKLVMEQAKGINVTIDTVERRGYEYHSGVTFTFFALNVRGELGSGGRYLSGEAKEPATGVSLFTDSLLRALPAPTKIKRIFLSVGTSLKDSRKLRNEGWSAISATEDIQDSKKEAARLGCTHLFSNGKIREL
ncbi:MAG: ATP phosphoribosyltransferase regulatory subunit [Rhodospirillales bacterium]|nr:ATP phosphoribosyltransferase regulatory subunit [Rhodospirillales bacterium]